MQKWNNNIETEPWYCELCHNIATQFEDEHNATPSTSEVVEAIPSELKWYKVDWQAHPEPKKFIESIIQSQPVKYRHIDANLRQLEGAQQASSIYSCTYPCHRYQELQLSNLEKQGLYSEHTKKQQRYENLWARK